MKVLRLREVFRRVSLSRSTLYRMIDEGRFPKRISLGPRAVGWHKEEIESWIASRPRAD